MGLVQILVREELYCEMFVCFGVLDPITGLLVVPLGGTFNVGGEVVCRTTGDCGVDSSRVFEYDG